jgi:polysaccharide pyruvyl transferase WcaK-like protein
MKPVVLVNHWHDDNRGDCAITLATLRVLQQAWPGRELVLHTLQSDPRELEAATRHVRRSFPHLTIRPSLVPALPLKPRYANTATWFLRVGWLAVRLLVRRPPPRLAALRDAHAVCLLGGSNIFVQGRLRPLGLARLLQVLAPGLVAERAGVPTYLLGHTIGPLKGTTSRWLVRSVLERAELTTLREAASAEFLGMLGVSNRHYRLAPDMAFFLAPARAESRRILEEHQLPPGRFLALAVRQHPYAGADADRRLCGELEAFARKALSDGGVERIAVIAQTRGPTAVEDDREISRALAAAIGDQAIFLDEDLDPCQLAGLYGAAHAVVAVRLHAAILALVGGVPAFGISYFTLKTRGVFELLGLPEMWCEFTDATPDLLGRWLAVTKDPRQRSAIGARAAGAHGEVRELSRGLG